MAERNAGEQMLIGRETELNTLKQHLEKAKLGQGSAVLISGEPGIGKTALVEAFKGYAATQNVRILSGAASADSAQPFLVFSKALAGEMDAPLFEEQEYTRFVKIFAINHAGMLLAQSSPEAGDMDADIFAGMLSAVQNFVSDSLDTQRDGKAGLGRLEYGNMKILIEHGSHLFLTGVFSGSEHQDMKSSLRRTLQRIEDKHGSFLDKWAGKVSEIEPIQREIEELAEAKFLVRRDLEGLKLENERLRIADRALECLARVSREKLSVVFLEDVQWADESSLAVLQYLAHNVGAMRLLLVCTARVSENAIAQAKVDMIRKEIGPAEIRLGGLGSGDLVSLIDTLFPSNNFASEIAGRLSKDCAGNPLFITEMLRQMASEKAVAKVEGKYMLVHGNFAMPASLEEIIGRRLETLDADSMAVVEYASCIGREFPVSVLSSIPTVGNIGPPMDLLNSAGILQVHDGKAKFSHAMFQEAVYNAISGLWKEKFHGCLGQHYERTFPNREGDEIYELARHFSMTRDRARAVDYGIRAGERAEGSFAVDRALEFYGYAQKAMGKVPEGSEHGTKWQYLAEKLGDIQSFAGEYRIALGHYAELLDSGIEPEARARILRKSGLAYNVLADYEKASACLDEGLALMSESNSPEFGRLCIVKAEVHMNQGEYDLAESLCDKAINSFGKGQGAAERDTAKVLRSYGVIFYRSGKYDRAVEYYRKSLDLLDPEKDEAEAANLTFNIGIAYTDKGEYAKALDQFSSSREIFEKRGDRKSLANIQNSMGIVNWLMGDIEKARAYYFESLAMMRRIGKKISIATTLNNIGATYLSTGEIEKAKDYYIQSLAMRREIDDKSGIVQTVGNLGALRIEIGEMDEAERNIDESIALSREIGDATTLATGLLNKAEMYNFLGRKDGAIELLDESMSLFRECGDMVTIVDVYFSMASHHVLAGDPAAARDCAAKALESALALEIESKREVALARFAIGKAERLGGNIPVALSELGQAADISSEINDRPLLVKIRFEMGEIHASESREAEARDVFSEALQLSEVTGMRIWADKCRKALEELDQ